jgi:cytochrome c551/c552
MGKGILIVSSVALALAMSACTREERTTTVPGAPMSSAPSDSAGSTASATTSTAPGPLAMGEPTSSASSATSPTESPVGSTSGAGAAGSGSVGGRSSDAPIGATDGKGAGGGSGMELLKTKGCMNCHDRETKKVGPSFKDIAAKKGNKEAIVTKLKEGKGHMKVAASDAELNAMVEAVLAMK